MWKFQINASGQTDGWNDNGIQTFRSNILKNLAREIIQNSVDAWADKSKPAEVEFTLFEFKREMLPGIDTLRDHLKEILGLDAKNEGESHVKEIEEAFACSKSSKFKVLIISDKNTKGMPQKGKSDTSSDFFRYIKTTGSSGGNQNRAGSHGLGKAAPLATTPLRTIFVSTMWLDKKDGPKKLFQGRSRLMSRRIGDDTYSGKGFWGDEDYQPIENLPSSEYEWLDRDVQGTTIAVPGFRTNANREWSSIVAGYVVSEFFAAVARGTLTVKLIDKTEKKQPEYLIDRSSINSPKKYFDNDYIKGQMAQYVDKDISELDDAKFYYDCLLESNSKVIIKDFTVTGLGRVQCRLIVEEGAPRKICLIRKNMKITEELSAGKSGKSLWKPGHVPAKIVDFGGVVEMLDEEGERLLRSMEPPQHNSLSIDNMPEADRDLGGRILDSLSQKLRAFVEEHATADVLQERTVSELSEYFYDDTEYDGAATTISKETDPNGRLVIHNKPLAKRKVSVLKTAGGSVNGTDEGTGDDTVEGKGGDGKGGDGKGAGKKPRPTASVKGIPLQHQRIIGLDKKFTVHLRAEKPFDGYLSILELGVDIKDQLKIDSSSKGELKKSGRIEISKSDFDKNKLWLEVELSIKPIGGLTISASEKE